LAGNSSHRVGEVATKNRAIAIPAAVITVANTAALAALFVKNRLLRNNLLMRKKSPFRIKKTKTPTQRMDQKASPILAISFFFAITYSTSKPPKNQLL